MRWIALMRLSIAFVLLGGLSGCVIPFFYKKKITRQYNDRASSFPLDIPLPIDAIMVHDDGNVVAGIARKYIFQTNATTAQLKNFYTTEIIESGWSMQYTFFAKDASALFVAEKPSKKLCINYQHATVGGCTIVVLIDYTLV